MDLLSLPQFPSALRPTAVAHAPRRPVSPRLGRALLGLGALSAAALAAYILWSVIDEIVHPPAPESPPDFKVIQERFGDVFVGDPVEKVLQLLGPPSPQGEGQPEGVEQHIRAT